MLADLQKVEDSFYSNQSIEIFIKSHPILQQIQLLNKTNKSQTRTRIKRYFYKLNQSIHYKTFLQAGVNQKKCKSYFYLEARTEFQKYIASENSEEYFQLLQKRLSDVIVLLDNSSELIPLVFSLVHAKSFGIKMIKILSNLYSRYGDHNCLYTQQITNELQKGLKSDDSEVQMRFVQIIANIAIQGGRSFVFVKDALENSLNIYNTQDLLLKMNIVQIISVLGQGVETSQLLRGHKVWAKVEKDALDADQEFYVRKSLLILLINMATHQQYQITPKFTKNLIEFLAECFKGQGQYLEAALQISSHLLRSNEGAKILIQNTQVFTLFLKQSRSPADKIKILFIQNLTSLTDKQNGKKSKSTVINILNCVGNPNLSQQLSQNINSNNFMVQGIEGFCKWFSGLLQLPFEDLELSLLAFFYNLLEYSEICEQVFQDQGVTKYILRPVGQGNSTKVLKLEKNRVVIKLLQKGKAQWKNTKLQVYADLIEKQLLKNKQQVEVATQAN